MPLCSQHVKPLNRKTIMGSVLPTLALSQLMNIFLVTAILLAHGNLPSIPRPFPYGQGNDPGEHQ